MYLGSTMYSLFFTSYEYKAQASTTVLPHMQSAVTKDGRNKLLDGNRTPVFSDQSSLIVTGSSGLLFSDLLHRKLGHSGTCPHETQLCHFSGSVAKGYSFSLIFNVTLDEYKKGLVKPEKVMTDQELFLTSSL